MIFIFYFFVLQFQILGFILDLQNFPFRTHSPQYNIWTNSRIFIFYVFLSCPSSLFMLFSYLNWVSLLIWCAIKIIRLSCSCRWGGGAIIFLSCVPKTGTICNWTLNLLVDARQSKKCLLTFFLESGHDLEQGFKKTSRWVFWGAFWVF